MAFERPPLPQRNPRDPLGRRRNLLVMVTRLFAQGEREGFVDVAWTTGPERYMAGICGGTVQMEDGHEHLLGVANDHEPDDTIQVSVFSVCPRSTACHKVRADIVEPPADPTEIRDDATATNLVAEARFSACATARFRQYLADNYPAPPAEPSVALLLQEYPELEYINNYRQKFGAIVMHLGNQDNG